MSGSGYSLAKGGKLKLKSDAEERKRKKLKKKEKKAKRRRLQAAATKDAADTESHGGWWAAADAAEISGNVALELEPHAYLVAIDNGTFALGRQHAPGEGPDPEEIFVAMSLPDGKLGLRSGYGKFLGLDRDDKVVGVADAVGQRETWQPVFESSSTALLGPNGRFLSLRSSSDADGVEAAPACDSDRVGGDAELLTLRCNRSLDADPKQLLAEEERQGCAQAEVNYARKFQSWQDGKLRLSTADKADLRRAKKLGSLHETMLDRREKQKSDKFCK